MGRPERIRLNAAHPLAQGLVFAGLGELPNSTLCYDSCATLGRTPNHGTLTSMAVPATATSGWAWNSFLRRYVLVGDGVDDYVALTPLLTVTPLTMACWFKANSLTTIYSLMSVGATASTEGFILELSRGTSARVSASTAHTTLATAFTSSSFVTKMWNHACGVWTSNVLRGAYLNGTGLGTDATDKTPSSITSSELLCNRVGSPTAGRYLDGSACDFMCWNRILSSSEIAALADPSNFLLSGLILPPKRRVFRAATAPPASNRRRRFIALGA